MQGLAIDMQDDFEADPSLATANSSKDNDHSEDETPEVTDDARGKQKRTRADSELEEATSRDSGTSSAAKEQQTNIPIFVAPLASRPPVDATASSSQQPPLAKKPCRRFGLLFE